MIVSSANYKPNVQLSLSDSSFVSVFVILCLVNNQPSSNLTQIMSRFVSCFCAWLQ